MDSRVNVYKNRPKSPINRTSQLFNYRKYLMLELAPEALISFSKARRGRLFRLSIFSLKMTLSLFLFKPKCNMKIQKSYGKLLLANSKRS